MELNTKSLNYSTILAIGLVVVLTIFAELSGSFKELLTDISGHHWTTKSVFSGLFFVISYFLLSRTMEDEVDSSQEVIYTILAVFIGGMLIFGYYVWHFVS